MIDKPLPIDNDLIEAGEEGASKELSSFVQNLFLREALSLGWLVRGLVVSLVLVASMLLIIMLWHYFGPESLHWLTESQLDRVESASVGALATAGLGRLSRLAARD